MAAVSRKYIAFEAGKYKVRDSQSDEVIFSTVKIGGSGGKLLSIVSSKWDFDGAKLSNVAAGSAAGEVLIYDQRGAANGLASLDGGGKVPVGQLPSAVMTYEGVYNATTNSPALVDGTGDAGMVYRVGTAGTQNFGSGNISFDIGDYVIYNGTTWEKSDTTDAVASIFGRVGVVTAQSGDYTAAQITNTPAGNIAATTVQAAINELDTEKADTSYVDGKVIDSIADADTTHAPSRNAVFDALALKADASAVATYQGFVNDNAGSITARQFVYVKSNGHVDKVTATLATFDAVVLVVKDASIATTATGNCFTEGDTVPGFSGLTPGKPVYVHASTAGSFTQDPTTITTVTDNLFKVGNAISATEMVYQPEHIVEL